MGALVQYFGWKLDGRKFVLEDEEESSFTTRLNLPGKMIILHSGQHSWRECLSWFREWDVIEKLFYSLKNDLAGLPLRAQKIDVVTGMIFVNLVALIIRNRLLALMRSTKLCRDHSLPSVTQELSKIRRMELPDGYFVTSLMTKK